MVRSNLTRANGGSLTRARLVANLTFFALNNLLKTFSGHPAPQAIALSMQDAASAADMPADTSGGGTSSGASGGVHSRDEDDEDDHEVRARPDRAHTSRQFSFSSRATQTADRPTAARWQRLTRAFIVHATHARRPGSKPRRHQGVRRSARKPRPRGGAHLARCRLRQVPLLASRVTPVQGGGASPSIPSIAKPLHCLHRPHRSLRSHPPHHALFTARLTAPDTSRCGSAPFPDRCSAGAPRAARPTRTRTRKMAETAAAAGTVRWRTSCRRTRTPTWRRGCFPQFRVSILRYASGMTQVVSGTNGVSASWKKCSLVPFSSLS